jgi:hypothetical protein
MQLLMLPGLPTKRSRARSWHILASQIFFGNIIPVQRDAG